MCLFVQYKCPNNAVFTLAVCFTLLHISYIYNSALLNCAALTIVSYKAAELYKVRASVRFSFSSCVMFCVATWVTGVRFCCSSTSLNSISVSSVDSGPLGYLNYGCWPSVTNRGGGIH